jgi:quercetin 2,3-dioxygenase
MKTVFHSADSRGAADHGWLKAKHSFSFAGYYDPERIHFGALRVLNDDYVAGGMGFGKHPHDNMEIITIPLEGQLEHKDSMGNTGIISKNDVQLMSAGTGVQHSEFNRNSDKHVKLLQIWVFPNKQNVAPRYDQKTFNPEERKNKFQAIVSPYPGNDDGSMWIYQDAWFQIGNFEEGTNTNYTLKGKNAGVYAFLLEGEVEINNQKLEKRDALGIWETDKLDIKINKEAELLLMEVPMQF